MNTSSSLGITENAWPGNILRCPNCIGTLNQAAQFFCVTCGFRDETNKDLRATKSRELLLSFINIPSSHPANVLSLLDTTQPSLTYRGPAAIRDSTQLMSEVSSRLPEGGAVLDLGCGPRDQAACLEFLDFKYVGVDYANEAADFLADAHALPFADASFDCVFSYAVLEHLHNPFLAMHEVSRVLKDGGWFIGTVSQGEPFHSSYFHHTPWGLSSVVSSVPNLNMVRMWASDDTLASLAAMGRYSKLIKAALALLNTINAKLPWLTPRKMRWPVKDKELDRLYRAGSICFAIQKKALPKQDVL